MLSPCQYDHISHFPQHHPSEPAPPDHLICTTSHRLEQLLHSKDERGVVCHLAHLSAFEVGGSVSILSPYTREPAELHRWPPSHRSGGQGDRCVQRLLEGADHACVGYRFSPAVSKAFRAAGLSSSVSKSLKRSEYTLKRCPALAAIPPE